MKLTVALAACFLPLSLSLSAECKAGYQSATVVKIFNQELGAGPSARAQHSADENGPAPSPTAQLTRTVILRAGDERYVLRLPADSAEVKLTSGQEVCLSKDGKQMQVTTPDGKKLPGFARAISAAPRTQ
jgi:hypothetical protein